MPPDANDLLRRATAPQTDTTPTPHALLIFAHQDDETVALGGRLGRYGAAYLLHVTDGAPRNEHDSRAHGFLSWQEYRSARAAELACALDLAGIGAMSHSCLEIADQEASLHLAEITRRIVSHIDSLHPEVILTHPYEGGHPDHDACAFAVHHAVAMRAAAEHAALPIIECGFYHAGDVGIETGRFLAGPGSSFEAAYDLTPEEQAHKRALLRCFVTQTDTLSYFTLKQERFRIAPQYDFTKPPHPGPAFYDGFPWGMETKRFCDLAAQAEQELNNETRA
ncbi:MAG: PIG-L deacetylase family protein [Acidobacteriota bacterium]